METSTPNPYLDIVKKSAVAGASYATAYFVATALLTVTIQKISDRKKTKEA